MVRIPTPFGDWAKNAAISAAGGGFLDKLVQ